MDAKDYQRGLTASRLRDVLDYDQLTGVFTWRVANRNAKIGAVAGTLNKQTGYRLIKVDGFDYLAHRLAHLHVTGAWPASCVDHVNLDRADNRWANLRPATRLQNAHNRGLTSSNSSGFKGVSASRGGWQANIRVNGKLKFLGRYPSPEAAHAAYAAAALQSFGHFARAS